MKIASSIAELIGNTPLIQLSALSRLHHTCTPVIAKLECFKTVRLWR